VNSSECLSLKFSGYDDKLAVLVKSVLDAVHKLKIDPERFEVLKEQVMRGYKNWNLNSPYEHAMYYVSYRLQDVLWHADEKIQVLIDEVVASAYE